MYAYDASFKLEGILGNIAENIQNMNNNTLAFLPYNPIIVAIGAFEGAGTVALSST
jgi:hypothetical protein